MFLVPTLGMGTRVSTLCVTTFTVSSLYSKFNTGRKAFELAFLRGARERDSAELGQRPIDERVRVFPLPHLFLKLHTLIHFQLSVRGKLQADSLKWPGSWTFKVDTVDIEARTMTRTFVFLLAFEPVRSATEMCTN